MIKAQTDLDLGLAWLKSHLTLGACAGGILALPSNLLWLFYL